MNEAFEPGRTVTRVLLTLAMMVLWLPPAKVGLRALGQEGRRAPHEGAVAADCTRCHTCERPTSEVRCLIPCTRTTAAAVAKAFSERPGPDIVYLDELEDRFLPVPFDHKGHAEMADMTGGCAVCHHYTPEGLAHPACKTCHEISLIRADMRKPALKGAYHRQCMGCHREWTGNTQCKLCHAVKTGQEAPESSASPTPSDILGSMHPPIPEPDTEIYQTGSQPAPGTQVIFRHREHTRRFGLKCVECHREDNCGRCHAEGRTHAQRPRTVEQHHRPCDVCHKAEMAEGGNCARCHWKEGQTRPKAFEHADTGWPLSKYHQDRSCRACHTDVPFVKLNRECGSCHQDWEPGVFDHAVTGQVLDETHAEIDCEECHVDRQFVKPPTCSECHDEDEGFVFPAKRPGPAVTP